VAHVPKRKLVPGADSLLKPEPFEPLSERGLAASCDRPDSLLRLILMLTSARDCPDTSDDLSRQATTSVAARDLVVAKPKA
jgi:hypothetical protein